MHHKAERATHVILALIMFAPLSGIGRHARAEEEPAAPQMDELPDLPDLEANPREREPAAREGKAPTPAPREQAEPSKPQAPRPEGARALRPAEMFGTNRGTGKVPGGAVRLIRLQHNGKDWNLNYNVDGDWQMLLQFHKRTNIPIARKTESVTIEQLARFPKTFSPPLLYVTGKKPFSIDMAEARLLNDYLLKRGGFIVGDSPGENFSRSFRAMILRTLGRQYKWEEIPKDDGIYMCYYILPEGAPPLWHHDGVRPLGIKARGRWIVFYHPGHMSDAWKKGHSGADKETVEKAYRLGTNLIYYAYTHYMDFHKKKRD